MREGAAERIGGAASASERRNGIWLEYQLHSAEANKPLSRSQKRKERETKSDLAGSGG